MLKVLLHRSKNGELARYEHMDLITISIDLLIFPYFKPLNLQPSSVGYHECGLRTMLRYHFKTYAIPGAATAHRCRVFFKDVSYLARTPLLVVSLLELVSRINSNLPSLDLTFQ